MPNPLDRYSDYAGNALANTWDWLNERVRMANQTNPLITRDAYGNMRLGPGADIATNLVLGMAGDAPKAPKALYHVAGSEWKPGQALRSLYDRYGDDAYEIFAERWPDAGNLGEYHAHHVMFFDNLEDALSHHEEVGGRVLKVDPSQIRDLSFDKLEKPGFWVSRSGVSPEAITDITPADE